MNWRIPLSDLRLTQEDRDAVLAALESNWLTMGERTQNFERLFAEALDKDNPPHCFAVGNCTVGLHMALAAVGVGPGDEVIMPSYTFCSTASAFARTGAKIVFCDIDPDDMMVDVDDMAARITPRTKALVPIHYGGLSCDVEKIGQLAAARGITAR